MFFKTIAALCQQDLLHNSDCLASNITLLSSISDNFFIAFS